MAYTPWGAGDRHGELRLGWAGLTRPLRSLSALSAGLPEHVALLPVRVPGQDEQQVGEPVEVLDREDVHRLAVLLEGRPCGALGTTGHRARDVQQRRARRTPVEDE